MSTYAYILAKILANPQMGVQAVSCERGVWQAGVSISSPAKEATEALQKSVDSMDSYLAS